MAIDTFVDNPVVPAELGLLLALRLDPARWEVIGVSVDQGVLDTFSDSDPDSPVLDFTTDSVHAIDLGSMTVYVSMKHGLRHECPSCGGTMGINKWVDTAYDSSPIMSMRTNVRISVPKLHCKHCGTFPKARCPLVVPNHTYTKLLKFDIISTLSEETVASTSRTCKVGKHIVADVLHQSVEEGKARQELSPTHTLFIDEIQSTHGQNYITMVADQDHTAICGVIGHDIQSVRDIRDWIVSKGGDPDRIALVCSDMSKAYKAGVTECFPKAVRVLDKFHVDNLVSKALEEVRKRTNRELKEAGLDYPKGVKYTVLYRKANHDEKHRKRMEEVRMYNKELALAFDLKEEFFDLFECRDKHHARSYFFSWYNRVRGSNIPEMVDVSKRLMKRLNEILRWFDHKVTNAVSEGMNNTYKKIKSAAFGFRNEQNLIDMCLFRKGKLKLSI